jgi:hypothetical protein
VFLQILAVSVRLDIAICRRRECDAICRRRECGCCDFTSTRSYWRNLLGEFMYVSYKAKSHVMNGVPVDETVNALRTLIAATEGDVAGGLII